MPLRPASEGNQTLPPLQTEDGEVKPSVKDPGHIYELPNLDGEGSQLLTFVKRFDPSDPSRFPGNTNAHPGTTLQGVIHCLIERVRYLDNQIPHENNKAILEMFRRQLWLLEERAAQRHGFAFDFWPQDMEELPMCSHCGHVVCPELGNANKDKH